MRKVVILNRTCCCDLEPLSRSNYGNSIFADISKSINGRVMKLAPKHSLIEGLLKLFAENDLRSKVKVTGSTEKREKMNN